MTDWQARFWAKVQQSDSPTECWLWLGKPNTSGYGTFSRIRTANERAHRVAYELVRGPIPAGMTLDHLCRVRLCVNPAHLEPVSPVENVMRGEGPTATRARQTHCRRGHPLSGDNLRIDKRGYRSCRRCRTDWQIAADRRSGRPHRAAEYAALAERGTE